MIAGAVATTAGVIAGAVVLRGRDGREPETWYTAEIANAHMLSTDGEVVCGTTLEDELFCADVETGKVRFAERISEGYSSAATIVDDVLVVASPAGVAAYSLDGEELWRDDGIEANTGMLTAENELPVAAGTAVVIDGGIIDSELVGIDVATGEERWRTYTDHEPGAVRLDPYGVHTDGERFYAALGVPLDEMGFDTTIDLVAIDAGSGAELWRSDLPEGAAGFAGLGAVVPHDDPSAAVVKVEGWPGGVTVLDTATGEHRWDVTFDSGDPAVAPLSQATVAHLAGTTVIADGETMRGYDAEGDELWEAPTPTVQRDPTITDPGELVAGADRLYLVGFDLIVLDPRTGETEKVFDDVNADDVVEAGDWFVAGGDRLSGVPLSDAG